MTSIPSQLKASAKARTDKVKARIRGAMREIEKELRDSSGAYHHGSGRLSMAEVCRRAGVHQVTLMGPSHKDTTRVEVKSWLAKLGKKESKGKSKIGDPRSKCQNGGLDLQVLAAHYKSLYSVEIPQRDAEIAKLRELLREKDRIIGELSSEKSTNLRRLPVSAKPK